MARIMIVAGGTGGHIIPAIAFGKWALKSGRTSSVSYVCGSRPIEREIYNHHGITPRILAVEGSPLGTRNPARIARRTLDMIRSWWASRNLLSRERPDGVFLFGGYVSLPFVLMCRGREIPVLLHEQNARAGKVTRIARQLEIPIAAGWPTCFPLPSTRYTVTGTPTRNFEDLQREVAWNKLNLGRGLPSGPIVLVLGGSLGSSRIADSVISLAGKSRFQNATFLLPGATHMLNWAEQNVCLLPRLWNPDPLFALADFAISRAGGSTLAELESRSIPTLVIPWPRSSDNHQVENARLFARKGLGTIWEETEPQEVLEERFAELARNREKQQCHRDSQTSEKSINVHIWDMVFESK